MSKDSTRRSLSTFRLFRSSSKRRISMIYLGHVRINCLNLITFVLSSIAVNQRLDVQAFRSLFDVPGASSLFLNEFNDYLGRFFIPLLNCS